MEKESEREPDSPSRRANAVNPAVSQVSLGRAQRELVGVKVDTHVRGVGEGKTF